MLPELILTDMSPIKRIPDFMKQKRKKETIPDKVQYSLRKTKTLLGVRKGILNCVIYILLNMQPVTTLFIMKTVAMVYE